MDPQNNNQENTATPKQQVVERVKAATNVLVTVNNNPSVDQLAAAIGFTLMLNKLGKHATAVFSGTVPSTLEFLHPGETIEQNTDSLRDFIVSLDKSKADKLRYKVEENVVKIFITPYRTSISEKDLEFTQGDFNVDVVLALGISVRENLDQAIVAHGRILHDATVITISAGQGESTLGNVNWQEPAASSLSEMIVSISEAFQGGLIDDQMATAFLTGIVAETERFSNPKTTPKVMTMSAQLMAAGANQQLIATELEKAMPLPDPVAVAPTPEPTPEPVPEPPAKPKAEDGALSIEHEEEKKEETEPLPPQEPEPLVDDGQIHIEADGTLKKSWEVEAEKKITDAEVPEASEASADKNRHKVIAPINQEPKQEAKTDLKNYNFDQPAAASQPFSAAMPEQPKEEAFNPLMPAEDTSASQTPLMPDPVSDPNPQPASTSDFPAFVPPVPVEPPQPPATSPPELSSSSLPEGDEPASDTLADIEEAVHSPHLGAEPPAQEVDSARNAVMDAINATPYDPSRPEPLQALNANPLGEMTAPAPQETQPMPDIQLPDVPAPDASTQETFPLQDPNAMFASHASANTPQFPVPEQPAPQVPGGMPLHGLGEVIPEGQGNDDMRPPPVPPPMMPM